MKIGVVIVTHYRLGDEFLQALRLIVPDAPEFHAVAIEPTQSVEEMRSRIAAALEAADRGDGVLVLTDMFGGTPSNISLSFLDGAPRRGGDGREPADADQARDAARESKSLEDLAAFIKQYGQRNISVAQRAPAGSGSVSEADVHEGEFVVQGELGLHARPASQFVDARGALPRRDPGRARRRVGRRAQHPLAALAGRVARARACASAPRATTPRRPWPRSVACSSRRDIRQAPRRIERPGGVA